jgi:hypothetical protein
MESDKMFDDFTKKLKLMTEIIDRCKVTGEMFDEHLLEELYKELGNFYQQQKEEFKEVLYYADNDCEDYIAEIEIFKNFTLSQKKFCLEMAKLKFYKLNNDNNNYLNNYNKGIEQMRNIIESELQLYIHHNA